MEETEEEADVKIKQSERQTNKDIKESKKKSKDKIDRKESQTLKNIAEADD